MSNFESRNQNEPQINAHEKREAFSIEKWKLLKETREKTFNTIELAEANDRAQEAPEQNIERAFNSLDEKGEVMTQKDIQSADKLIAEIEARYPEIGLFADEQYA